MIRWVEKNRKKEYTCSMKKMYIIIEKQNELGNLKSALEQLRIKGVEVFWSGSPLPLLTGDSPEEGEISDVRDIFVLTDIPQIASLLAEGGYPVLVYVHAENKEMRLPHIKYVIEGFEDVGGEYFYRVWQRLTEKPWFITETERCIIRETTESDVDAFYEIYKEPSITEYMESLFEDRGTELQYVKDYREKVYDFYGFGMWTVLDKKTGKVIGRAGVSMREGFDDPELGFVIAKDYQGKGLAAEVCRAVLEFACREFGFSRFQALVHKNNIPSRKLLEKLGFSYSDTVPINDESLQLFLVEYSPII